MDDLRVAFFTGNHNYTIDGVVLTSNRQVSYLLEHGVKVRVYAPTKSTPPAINHVGDLVPVPSLPFIRPYRLAMGMTRKVRRDLEMFNPNIVYIATPDPLGFAALRWARVRRIPTVTTYHTNFSSYLKYYHVEMLSSLVWYLHRRFYGRCDEVNVATASMIAELQRHGVSAPYVLSPLGVDTDRFSPDHRSEEWRQNQGFLPGEVVITFVGRLVWEKSLDVFAKTINALEEKKIPHRSMIIGSGPADEELRRRLPRTRFTGRLVGDELSFAYASSDIFFFPSASETFGCVNVEALASGLPCVVADAPGSRDIIRDGLDGIVCPVDDVKAYSDALTRLIEDPELRDRYRKSGVLRAEEYHWDQVLSRMLEQFERLAAASVRNPNIWTLNIFRKLPT